MRKPKRSRHAISNTQSRNAYRYLEVNGAPFGAPILQPVYYFNFVCPSSLIRSNYKTFNPWSFESYRLSYLRGQVFHESKIGSNPTQNYLYYGAFGSGSTVGSIKYSVADDLPVTTSMIDFHYNRALNRLYDEVKQTDLNALLSTYELRELSKLTDSLKHGLRDMTKTLRGPIKAGSLLLAGGWLTWQYAIKPVLSDIDAIKDFTALLTNDMSVKASSSAKWYYKETDEGGRRDKQLDGAFKTKFGLKFSVRDAVEFDAWRLGLRSPASFLYESVPFSFVLDWMYDLGGYFESFEASYGHGLIFRAGYVTQTYRNATYTQYSRGIDISSGGNVSRSYPALIGTLVRKKMNRSVLGTFPVPRTPSLDLDLASSQLLSAAALLRSFFR